MAAKRKYNIKGTKDFLVMAGIFFFLCIWAIFDGWYPSKSVQKKHPRSAEASFEVSGVMKRFHVGIGDSVVTPKDDAKPTLIAELKSDALEKKLEKAKSEYTEFKKLAATGKEVDQDKLTASTELLNEILEKMDALKLYAPKMGNEKNGTVTKILVDRHTYVEAGDPVIIFTPNTHFYVFNKSLAIISLLAFIGFLFVHIFGH